MRVDLALKIKELETVAKNGSSSDLAAVYLDYIECRDKTIDAALFQYGLPQDNDLVAKIAGIQSNEALWAEAICSKADILLNNSQGKMSHKDRKEKIEDAIRLLLSINDKSAKTLIMLARAYLLRSRIIRSKGLTIPEKKKEAINKGISHIEFNSVEEAPDPVIKKEAGLVRAFLYLELEKVDKFDAKIKNLCDVLKYARDCGAIETISVDNIKIAVRLAELTTDQTLAVKIIDSAIKGAELERARAYSVISGKEAEISTEMKAVIRKLESAFFSDPLWEDSVEFLLKLREDGVEGWKALALQSWLACSLAEKNISSTLHIRWYWSRMRSLYDLAFIAAGNNYEQKAKIADSLKSRPALRWQGWNELAQKDPRIKEHLDAEDAARTGKYVKQINELYKSTQRMANDVAEHGIDDGDIDFNNVPSGWVAIHYYINQLDKKCYALIYNPANPEDSKWTEHFVENIDGLFSAYMEWQVNYSIHKDKEDKREAAKYLAKLCKNIGSAMSFLFDPVVVPNSNKVVFMPHDFLHRLSLHGAVNSGDIFLEQHACCYLPAWSYAKKNKNGSTNGNYLFGYVPESTSSFNTVWSGHEWSNKAARKGAMTHLLEDNASAPNLLVLWCHGTADAINPFNAKLHLKDRSISYHELTTSTIKLDGSKVVLGACETDLAPALSDVIDEHLSFSTAFMNKNASEILGTMWKVLDDNVAEIVESIFADGSILTVNAQWQKNRINEYRIRQANGNNTDNIDMTLYDCLVFRTMGMVV